MKRRITAVIAMIMIRALSLGSIGLASGTNEIPGGYVAPPTKPAWFPRAALATLICPRGA